MDHDLVLTAARDALAALPLCGATGLEQELRVARAATRRFAQSAGATAGCGPTLAELRSHCRPAWIFELVLPVIAPVADEVTKARRAALPGDVARYAARIFARRAADDRDYLARASDTNGPDARAEFYRLCELGSAFCDPTPFAAVVLGQAERIVRRSKFRAFQIAPEDVANGALLAFTRRRADDDFAPGLTPDKRKEAERVFAAFCGLTALQLRARKVRAARNLTLVDEFANEAPTPGLPPELEDARMRATLDAATRVLSRTEQAVIAGFRAGKSPAVIAKEHNSTVFAVQKHRSRAVAKIQRSALDRVSQSAVIPAVWELVCAVRVEFDGIVSTARAAACKPTAVEITKEMMVAAQENVAAARGLTAEYVQNKIDFACRTAFPGVPAAEYEPSEADFGSLVE